MTARILVVDDEPDLEPLTSGASGGRLAMASSASASPTMA
jgi:hypothetical protein